MFNYTVYNDDGELLMLNTYTGRMMKASPEKSGLIQNILNESNIDSEDVLATKLKAEGMLVDKEEDEKTKLQALFIDLQSHPVLTLMILPTEQCNFRCSYCPETFEKGRMSEGIQKTIVEYVRKNISSYTGLRINWFGGEPLLEMGIIRDLSLQFKQICKTAKRSYSAQMTTNAYLLSYDVFKELLDYNVYDYQITLDGLKEAHDTQRCLVNGDPTYDTIVKNLIAIKQHSKSGKFRIYIRTNFTKSMIPTIPKYIDWFYSAFENDKRFLLDISMAGDFGGEKVRDMKNELISDTKHIENFFETLINSNIQKIQLAKRFFSPGSSRCYAGDKNFYVIDANGNVRKCHCWLNDDHKNKIGCVLEDGFVDIDKQKNDEWIIPRMANKCNTCFLLPACFGHACAGANMYQSIPKCPKTKWIIGYYLKIYDKQGLFQMIE